MALDRLFVFKVINILVIITSVIVCLAAVSDARRHFAPNVFYIAPIINDGRLYFSTDDIEALKEEIDIAALAIKTVSTTFISSENFSVRTRIFYTNSDYFGLKNITFLHGGGWRADMESDNVAVINGSLAWTLFGSLDVVDMDIYISGESYMVIGVVEQRSARGDDAAAFIPLNPAPLSRVIGNLYISSADDNMLIVNNALIDFLTESGRSARDYYITSIDRFIINIGLKFYLLIFIIGMYAAAIILINCVKLIRRNPVNKKTLPVFAALLPLAVLSLVLIIRAAGFEVWIPYAGGTRIRDITAAITNNGFLPSPEYLCAGLSELVRLNGFANAALIAGLIALFNFIFVHKEKKADDKT